MPDNVGETTLVTLAGVGTVAASYLLFIMTQTLKNLVPTLRDRAAIVALYIMSLLVSLVVIYPTTPDWTDPMTYVSVAVLGMVFGDIAKSKYADLFKVSVQGVPPPPDAEVSPAAVSAQDTGEHPVTAPRKYRRKENLNV